MCHFGSQQTSLYAKVANYEFFPLAFANKPIVTNSILYL